MLRKLTHEEKCALWIALNCRNNYIETGDVALGAQDVAKIGSSKARRLAGGEVRIKALEDSQMRLILLARKLVTQIISDKFYIEE